MNNRQWILQTVAAVGVVVTVAITSLLIMDDYGLFRRVKGRSLPIFYADRMGKALLNIRYVPSNFDALLIGPSSSVNWEPQVISQGTGLRMYNESVEGGNATEERLLVDRALEKGRFKLGIIVLYPSMMSSHDYHDGIDRVRWAEALGSFNAYTQTALSEMTLHKHIVTNKQHASADGSHELRNPKGVVIEPIDFHEDPVGMKNLKGIADDLQCHGIRIVYVVPTVYESVLRYNREGFTRFVDSMRARLPQAPLIDLTAPEYTSIRSNPDNYIDGYHVTPEGARLISQILNERLRAILSQE